MYVGGSPTAMAPYLEPTKCSPESLVDSSGALVSHKLDLQFNILRLLSGLIPYNLHYLDSYTHSPCPLDASLLWPVATFLHYCSPRSSRCHGQLSRLHLLYATQLEMYGLWPWACLVLMLMEDKSAARSAIREMIYRNPSPTVQARDTLVKFGVPERFFVEATAIDHQRCRRWWSAAVHWATAHVMDKQNNNNKRTTTTSGAVEPSLFQLLGHHTEQEDSSDGVLVPLCVNLERALPEVLLDVASIVEMAETILSEDRMQALRIRICEAKAISSALRRVPAVGRAMTAEIEAHIFACGEVDAGADGIWPSLVGGSWRTGVCVMWRCLRYLLERLETQNTGEVEGNEVWTGSAEKDNVDQLRLDVVKEANATKQLYESMLLGTERLEVESGGWWEMPEGRGNEAGRKRKAKCIADSNIGELIDDEQRRKRTARKDSGRGSSVLLAGSVSTSWLPWEEVKNRITALEVMKRVLCGES
eukprot:GHVS01033251.1.p1 GENE.GHVS01033251.1~~GHVS01033251.1.p1  ORF type:complete len:475 (-),score=66.51 GHVS01033251.1:121-1545(-)